jgi:hypothetical protein
VKRNAYRIFICYIITVFTLSITSQIIDFRVSQWSSVDAKSALGCLCCVDVSSVADILDMHVASIFSDEVCTCTAGSLCECIGLNF